MDHNVFIFWSGERSRRAAVSMRKWLPSVVQAARPWLSDTDLDRSVLWRGEISKRLAGVRVGIVCLTPENLNSGWIHFEAGAIARTVDDGSRVCTYLLAGLEPKDIPSPLGDFNSSRAVREDTLKLVNTVNTALGTTVAADMLETVFKRSWTDLETELATIVASATEQTRERKPEEMIAEILELVRADVKRWSELDPYKDVLDELMPFLRFAVTQIKSQQVRTAMSEYDSYERS